MMVGIANISEQGFFFPNAFKMRSNIYVVDTIGRIQKVLNRDKLYITRISGPDGPLILAVDLRNTPKGCPMGPLF